MEVVMKRWHVSFSSTFWIACGALLAVLALMCYLSKTSLLASIATIFTGLVVLVVFIILPKAYNAPMTLCKPRRLSPIDRFLKENPGCETEIAKSLAPLSFKQYRIIKRLLGYKVQKKSVRQIAAEEKMDPDEIMVIWRKFTMVFKQAKKTV